MTRERSADGLGLRCELPIIVRRAGSQDNQLLAEMGFETFSDAFGPDNSPQNMTAYLESSFSPAIQAEELADPLSVFLIAEVDGAPVGYARLLAGQAPDGIEGSNPIEIVRFYARSAWIGQKVGATLMDACLREARERGCDAMWLGVWERNRRALSFYEKWGFNRIGTQRFRLGQEVQTDILMARHVFPGG